jgi:signal transduction histidine kinase
MHTNNMPIEPLDPAQIKYLAADLDSLSAALLKSARDLVAGDGVAAAVLRGQDLRVLAGDGPAAGTVGSTCRLQHLGAHGQALLEGRPVLVVDTLSDRSWRGLPGQEQARSWLAAPLAAEGETIGILTWTALEPGRFGEETLARAAGLAARAAPALRWAQRVESVRRNVGLRAGSRRDVITEGTQPETHLERIARAAHELAGARAAFIYLADRETGRLRCVAATGYRDKALGSLALRNDGSLSAWIMAPPLASTGLEIGRTDRELLDGLGIKDTLLLPLLVDGRPVGFLGVADRRDGAPFGDYITRQVTELAGAASRVVAQIGTGVAHVGPVDYDLLVPASSVAVGVLTPAGQISFANPALSELVVRPGQALRDRYLSEFMGAGDSRRFVSVLGEVLATGQSRMMELRLGARGYRRSMQLSMASLHALLGAGGRILAVVEDGTRPSGLDDDHERQLKELQDKIEALAELDLLRSRFLSDISHELRTPLAVIKMHATLARIGRPERQAHYLRTIEQETHRLEMTVENVLDLARIDRQGLQIHPEWLQPEEMVARVLEVYGEIAEQKGITLTNGVQGPLPRLWTDKNHLAQILTNLLDNALRYTRPGGRVWVEAQTSPPGAQPELEISVGDTGLGIPEDEQQKVFERFYRGSNNPPGTTGTGLGLAIIRELMAANGGTITLVSRPGEGSVFTLHFPLPQEGSQNIVAQGGTG